MDNDRFDRLTRSFGAGRSRRSVLTAAVAAAAAMLPGLVSVRAAQVLRPLGAICRKDGECIANASCVKNSTGRQVCSCVNGTVCGTRCATAADFASDPANCGGCGKLCPAPGITNAVATCTAGVCGVACATGYKLCDGACIPNSGCCTHADCNDGVACTVDLCGPTSHTCAHLTISDTCLECSSSEQCRGAPCCGGRCCPAGSTCSTNGQGIAVCCPVCEKDSCCDQITFSSTGGVVGYTIAPAKCLGGTGVCADCPTFCTPFNGGYGAGEANGGICGVDNACNIYGFAPVGGWA
jgi:hypothetical protein